MTVLVSYVPTPVGDAAFDAGLDEAARRGENVVVVNSPHGGATVDADLVDEAHAQRLSERAEQRGVTVEWRRDAHGDDVVDVVQRVADDVDASLVVIGLRRRSPVGKLLLGSVAQRILLHVDRPVLAVKAPA
ncbi:universal stress protein [Aeromicrobium camelliae]|uniref:Universal stress protein n=1 Tax=Aeromicrobium camelliae TaxID=1538144 RepID=A0A3N6WN08_9ACTN|nr:universal stress protein [Aeromicrobium camelliae]RQN08700.1 universal stress protein [Aeromicrobium camelliae]